MHKLRLKAYGVGHRARLGMELEEGNCGFWIADFGFKGKKLGIRIYERRWNIGMVE